MKTRDTSSTLLQSPLEKVLQVKVRSDLRVGANVDACEKSVEEWKRNYYKWYEAAKYKNV